MNYKEACNYFPGGTQLLSKRPNQYSEKFPYSYQKAKGIEIVSNNKTYKDYSTMGIGSCILGYSDVKVNSEVIKEIYKGNMASLNSERNGLTIC